MTTSGLRLVVFDTTDRGGPWRRRAVGDGADGRSSERFGLSPVWRLGARGHTLVGAADAWLGATSWSEALSWVRRIAEQRGRRVDSLQLWGHGGWGFMAIGRTRLDTAALGAVSPLAAEIDGLRDALSGPRALVWLRCCSAFGHAGRNFARTLADRLGSRVAGHTHIINFFQSGTHSLAPGAQPSWGASEGVRFQRARAIGAMPSSPFAPNTVTCLRLDLPSGL